LALVLRFALIAEGSTDRRLAGLLQELCLRAGADEVIAEAPDLGRVPDAQGHSVAGQIRTMLHHDAGLDLVFVHRDADDSDGIRARAIVSEGIAQVAECPVHVCVVPVQETEAWLLLDEPAIRMVAGRPNGRVHLGLPSPGDVEAIKNPKELLHTVILAASELSGHRLRALKRRLPAAVAILLDRLDADGPLCDVPSVQTLIRDIEVAVTQLGQRQRGGTGSSDDI
jgi:hypothetical protein